jgi:phosphoribosylamine---glycine ligase
MTVLVVGGGGREHALVWALSRDRSVSRIICAPGNAGIADLAACMAVDVADPQAVLALAAAVKADLTIVGPELPLTKGVANAFAAAGRAIVGPTREAAALESSKAFAKAFMSRHRVPTARHRVCDDPAAALGVLASGEFSYPVVLKADGLAAGKGVVVAPDRAAAEAAVREAMVARRFGDAGDRLVIEEFLEGREASFFVVTDGRAAVTLPSAEDHKRAFDRDQGPNTGGMGAFAPSPLLDAAASRRVLDEIVYPVIEGMRAEGQEFRGFLYVGLMMTRDGPKVVEFNVRLGDPETQVVLPLVGDGFVSILSRAAAGRLEETTCPASDRAAVGVVLASAGYPEKYETGKRITGLERASSMGDVIVFHAGTAARDGDIVTAGGRGLTVVGLGTDYREAIRRAYEAVSLVSFEGRHFRRDIGARAVMS